MAYIYKITNDINNKPYIGQTVRKVKYRFAEHITLAKTKYSNGEKLTHLQQAIITYGEEHFHIEIIEECSYTLLDEREIYWIKYYDSFKNGYNMTEGGQLLKHTGQYVLQYGLNGQYIRTFQNIREVASVYDVAEGTIRSACNGQIKGAIGFQWRYYSVDFPMQIEPINNYHQKKRGVNQYNLKGELINTFDSVKEAANYNNISQDRISYACRTKGTSKSGGFQWRYVGDVDIPTNIEKPTKDKTTFKTSNPVNQYDKEWNFIKHWDTIREAAKELGIRSCLIINNCENKQNSAGGYHWSY